MENVLKWWFGSTVTATWS